MNAEATKRKREARRSSLSVPEVELHVADALRPSVCPPRLCSTLPDGRVAAGVKDSKNLHPVCVWPVEHAVGEARHDRFPNVTKDDDVHEWICGDPVKDLLDTVHEVNAQPRPLPF